MRAQQALPVKATPGQAATDAPATSATATTPSAGARARTVRATWPLLAALGAGLIEIAVAASAPPLLGALLAALGVASLIWATLGLRAGRLPVPRVAMTLAAAAPVAWVAAAFTLSVVGTASGASMLPALPLAAAVAFDLFVALECARIVRSGERPSAADGWRLLVGLAGGAVLVAALATPALAATDAGGHPHDHGGVPGVSVPPGHQH
ncbi:hypothetical protein WDJ51_11245 [Rathayibacter sp. YIM 133350]|uniref:hypothetical protein n=1 Tax=Rathayibacter sp. YIM 133350 TaxID=3131992 RepID=UPI00307F1D69